jgi:hypothetical protein
MDAITDGKKAKTMDKGKGLLTGNENGYHDQWKKGRFFMRRKDGQRIGIRKE